MLRVTKTSLADEKTHRVTINQLSKSDNYAVSINQDEMGLLMVFDGSLEYLGYGDDGQLSRLPLAPGLLFNSLGVPVICPPSSDSVSGINAVVLKIKIEFCRSLLSNLRYRSRWHAIDQPLNSLSLPFVTEMNVFLKTLQCYVHSGALVEEQLLCETKVSELFCLLNYFAKDSFDRFVSQYFSRDRVSLDLIMNTCYSQNLSVTEIAALAGYSVSTFKRKFNEVYRCSPRRWIQNRRLMEARRLLLESSDRTISEIGYAVGFENISHFIHSFKAKFGETPGAVQEKHTRDRLIRVAS